ncbi:glycosyltransferase family 2 protein [Alistipes sp.]|uniref:glycosyltransferase family 2 protein n=1 Tax=Alistipes sp. TaxID=1872444 RepID=UPI003AF16FA5
MTTNVQPLISIIIPVYNVGHYLNYTLDCVSNQDYPNLEILIIDDGSTDDSLSLCRKYALRDPRFKVFHQPNQGVSQARNKGLELASGTYIGFVDSDDMPAPNMFSSLYADLIASRADLAICDTAFIGENTTEIVSTPIRQKTTQVYKINGNWQKFLWGKEERKFYCIWDKLFKREILQEYGILFDRELSIGEDTLFTVSYFLCCNTIAINYNTFYNHRIRQGSLMRSPIPDLAKQQIHRIDKLETFVQKKLNDKEIAGELIRSFKARMLITFLTSKQLNKYEFIKSIHVISTRKDILNAFYHKAKSGSKREKLTAFIFRYIPLQLATHTLYFIR